MLNGFRRRRMQTQLFYYYSVLVVGVILLLALVLYIYFEQLIQAANSETVLRLAENISDRLDIRIERMDNVAKRVVFSDAISQDFLAPRQGENLLLPLATRRSITNELQEILSPSLFDADQVNLINYGNGRYVTAGSRQLQTVVAFEELSASGWIKETLAQNGLMVVTSPHTERWSPSMGKTVFSVSRAFSHPLNEMLRGVVQVTCEADVLGEITGDVLAAAEDQYKVFVYDDTGAVVYASQAAEAAYYYVLMQGQLPADSADLLEQEELLAHTVSAYSGWTVLLVTNETTMTSTVSSFFIQLIWILVAAIPATLLVSYVISRRFTRPIKAIYHEIGALKLRNMPEVLPNDDSGFNELDDLLATFQSLCRQLELLISEAATAQSYEIQARMKTLQTQINPHFLYNTFATIQTMADELEVPEIADISDGMSTLLRYALERGEEVATVQTEAQIASVYLDLMHRRYRGQVSYSIDIDPEIEDVPVPRMILQPLLENCFQHAFEGVSAWEIQVRGVALPGGGWCFQVLDNGRGFRPDVVRQIQRAIRRANMRRPVDQEQKAGMGLINVGIRMRLEYDRRALFELGNRPEGGGVVTIGAKGEAEQAQGEEKG